MAAWRDALNECGLPVQEAYWVEGNWSSASGAQAAANLFDQYPDMDAVFAANDQMALGLLQAAEQRGLRIPEQIGVVGFDNIPELAYFSPALTTIQQDQHGMARLAVEEIIKIIEANWQEQEKIEFRTIILSPVLIVRQSSLRDKNRR